MTWFCEAHYVNVPQNEECPICTGKEASQKKYSIPPPPTTEWRRAPKVVCKHCIFMMGVTAGVAIMALFR